MPLARKPPMTTKIRSFFPSDLIPNRQMSSNPRKKPHGLGAEGRIRQKTPDRSNHRKILDPNCRLKTQKTVKDRIEETTDRKRIKRETFAEAKRHLPH